MADWFWIENGTQQGPCNSNQLKDLAASGRLSPETMIWKPGFPDWVPARRVSGLFAAPPMPASPAPPPLPFQAQATNVSPPAFDPSRAYEPALALFADFRQVSFRDEVVPIDSRNIARLAGDYVFWSVTLLAIVPLLIATLSDREHQLTAFALFFAIFWGVLFKYFVIRKSNDWLLCLAALFGTGLIGVKVLLWSYQYVFPKFYLDLATNNQSLVKLLGFVLQVGLCEELVKSVPVLLYLAWARNRANVLTVLLVGVFSGLGFAAFENMLYGNDSIRASFILTHNLGARGLAVGVQSAMINVMLRSLSLVFCHAIWAGIVAYFLALGNLTGRRRIALYLIGLAVAATLHGLYNWLNDVQFTFAGLVVAGSFVLFYAYISKLRILVESEGGNLTPQRMSISPQLNSTAESGAT